MAPPSSTVSNEQSQVQTLNLTIIPGLPNDLAALILVFVPYSHHSRLKSICKSWKLFFSSKTIISLRQKHLPPTTLSPLLCIFPQDPLIASPYLFDPVNLAWSPLPPMPCNPHVYGLCNFTSISVGSYLYVLGGSLFDTRSFPLDCPCPSSSAFRFDFVSFTWENLSSMINPRGSFACAATPNSDKILVAGGGSRHTMFAAAGSRISSVEMYDIGKDEWVPLDGLPRFRAGCVGFFVGNGEGEEEKEFWVMGGYGESRTVSGVFPVDQYYRDVVVMEMKNGGGGKWRELGDMWEEGERWRLGKIVVVEDGASDTPAVFMLDQSDIFRYEMASNSWVKETSVPRKTSDEASVGFVALDEELHVMTHLSGIKSKECQRLRQQKRSATLLIQIYHPRKKSWRCVTTNPPFHHPLDFKTAVMCTICL
ncbi:F-box/kelch-repeat protein OR23 [Nicotiana tabacum]|uniref:F-box/kelch-repeat protein OR23 n=1 Tax=Nicotiana tabacum TaxID=4097 RepID=A0A1S4DRN7_TOBAC|nr:F-box/kelch-repeat protein OR23 [Nicotiana tomentosiformis]XP_016516077.1 PREDICTED: F-box/kelch-repeat protein OR23-like [Nicotiana tabacum]